MSFLNFNLKDTESNALIQGANAPKNRIIRDALFVPRNSGMVMPNNAPAQNYRGGMVGNTEISTAQGEYIDALRRNKVEGVKMGAASWIGKSFG